MITRRLSLVCIALAFSCSSKSTPKETGRGVLVIAIDALRADHMSCYGYDRPTTPVLDAIAAQGVVFANAFSASPELLPAHAALLTGCDPRLAERPRLTQGIEQPLLARWYIPDAVPRLAQEFLARGYETAAFLDHPTISHVFGFGAGFQSFYGWNPEEAPPRTEMGFESVAWKLLNWLTETPTSKDWFAYVHLNDLERLWIPDDTVPPDPKWDTFFEPRPELGSVPPVGEADELFFAIPRARWDGGTMSIGEYEARYDGALCQLDTKFRWLFEGLRRKGRLLNTTVAIVGTHGFSFGESGLILDSGTLSDADLHVPLIVRPAPALDCVHGGKSDVLASLIDVAPTLLELSKIEKPKGMHGVSLAGPLHGRDERSGDYVFASGGLQSGFVVFDGRYCFEKSTPGASRGPRVALSWYGDETDLQRSERTFLHDRWASRGLGHVHGGASDPAAALRMEAAGREWFEWIDVARGVLQGSLVADREKLSDELRRRGLIQ